MRERGDADGGSGRPTDVFDLLSGPIPVTDPRFLGDVVVELRDGLGEVGLGPAAIETALDGVTLPEVGDLDPETSVRTDAAIGEDQADAVVDAGGQAVDVMIEGSGDAASVLVDTGSDVVEVTTEGGEAAAEATAELLVAALDGV